MVRTLSVLGLLVSLVSLMSLRAAPAMAQDDALDDIPIASQRPTSGEASLLSGRTLGVGEVMVAAAAGWPWIWAQVELALTSSFNLGIRPALIYGSPFMALEPGVGGELAVPMRIHLYGEGDLDLAAFITPAFAIGEAAATAGEGGTVLAGDLGIGSRLELGARLGFRAMEGLTLLVGAGGDVGFVYAEAAGAAEVIGAAFLQAGIEGLISRDTMLFALIDGGIGFAPSRGAGFPLFRESVPPLLRISLGVAYLL